MTEKLFFQNISAEIQTGTKFKVDYKGVQTFVTAENLLFTLDNKAAEPVKAGLGQLPSSNVAVGITVALQKIGYDIISTKQMNANNSSLDGRVSHERCFPPANNIFEK